jgi:hypothetical protein
MLDTLATGPAGMDRTIVPIIIVGCVLLLLFFIIIILVKQ